MLEILVVSTLLQTAPAAPLSLDFAEGQFLVRQGEQVTKIPINRRPPQKDSLFMLKTRGNYIVWDKRGLVIRTKSGVKVTHFEAIARSPKVLSNEQLKANARQYAAKTLSDRATGLSGSEFVGETLYLVPRWEDKSGKPWLEALVAIDLNSKSLTPQLVGKIPGLSLASGLVSDELHRINGRLLLVAKTGATWGLSSWSLAGQFPQYVELGSNLLRYSTRPEDDTLAFVERASYGPEVAGMVTLSNFQRQDLVESSGDLRFVSLQDAICKIEDEGTTYLRNGFTGREISFRVPTAFQSTDYGILAWSPPGNPERASLLRNQDFGFLAAWQRAP